jgi:hypothetical protein
MNDHTPPLSNIRRHDTLHTDSTNELGSRLTLFAL